LFTFRTLFRYDLVSHYFSFQKSWLGSSVRPIRIYDSFYYITPLRGVKVFI
jgi:hypothetical protein